MRGPYVFTKDRGLQSTDFASVFGPSWAFLGLSRAVFGPSWLFGKSLGAVEPFWAVLEPPRAVLEA